jgi:hypothetical protein
LGIQHRLNQLACNNNGGPGSGDTLDNAGRADVHTLVVAEEPHAAPPSPVVIGEIAAEVEAVGEFVGQLAQLVGAMLGA